MTSAALRFAVLVVLVCGAVAGQDIPDLRWRDARALGLEGQGWSETAAPFDRLPARAHKLVREPVWQLSHCSAGLCVRFVTDARELWARWTLTSSRLQMVHMPATGVSGLDLYQRTEKGWHWLGVGKPRGASTTARLLSGAPAGRRELLLYLPLYNGVKTLEIGVPPAAELRAAEPRPEGRRRPLVFYGTSITQGGCASRPGMCHTALLGRWLQRPVINLGFSGNGTMDLPLAGLLGELDAAVFVIDCLPNMDAAQVAERVEPFVRGLRKARPDTPILLVEDRSRADAALLPAVAARHHANRAALQAGYQRLVAAGVPGLHYLAGGDLLGGDGEATVDGSHPTDLGFFRQAHCFEAALRPLLSR